MMMVFPLVGALSENIGMSCRVLCTVNVVYSYGLWEGCHSAGKGAENIQINVSSTARLEL